MSVLGSLALGCSTSKYPNITCKTSYSMLNKEPVILIYST